MECHVDDAPEVLQAVWGDSAPPFAAAITGLGALPAAIDVLSHEHDIRHALGRPGGRDDELIPVVSRILLRRLGDRVHLAAVIDGVPHEGTGDGPLLGLRSSAFEVFRAAMGRRSLDQVRALDWTGDPAPVLDSFFVFGPAEAPILE